MRVAFIAGPYRAETIDGIWENVQEARKVAKKYWAKGYAVICPHTNTAMMDGFMEDDQAWLPGAIELMRRSDVVVFMWKFRESPGAVEEHRIAIEEKKEIIYDFSE